ncbi:MAG: ArsR family transcriptional regulator, lead/cadmium/zinc/bismuth-responsive transcriptional [Methanosarcinales archaeon]|nr:MAG: Transcriptional regulator, ArsR family [Euryarchaeota archaeon 55_53]KUK29753.1 MAG: Transcriptional regulator, ArsR family [Methanosarcinales archeaon 56_1174]MDI3488549.1 ArsR family transcriptional regulator, lead/cadmium/zinc/bismuth-responsive transcriptional [Methanosarcinales archaeon]MDN5295870.1 ArsR family transcriptional regulator, lead/cadmium/zinc/bismuth-responsive transcriptional [Methanosarcinales archaeon]
MFRRVIDGAADDSVELASTEEIERLCETFGALADPTRLRILTALLCGERCVNELAETLGISQSAASHQLKLLRALRLVKHRRVGRKVCYSLDDEHIVHLIRVCTEHVRERR